MKPYFISRIIVHSIWAVIQIFILCKVINENFCMVKWAYFKPFMVYPKGSETYNLQMRGFVQTDDPDSDQVKGLLASLGDLYEEYTTKKWFLWTMNYGKPNCEQSDDCWVNWGLQIKLVCAFTFLFEILQVLQYFLYYKGYKMKRGFFLYLKYALAILPIFGTILFFIETHLVLGFNGRNCLCDFEEVFKYYNLEHEPNSYMCMDSVGSFYINLIYVKFFYVVLTLVLIVYRVSIKQMNY